jgi:penicillin-binding protein 1C
MRRRRSLVILGVLIGTAAAVIWCIDNGANVALPSLAEVRDSFRPSDMNLLDRHGQILHDQRIEFHGRRLAWTALAEISPALQTAVIAAEDRRFYHHRGVDSQAVLNAVARGLIGKSGRGASTITMQLATLIDPELRQHGTPRTFAQKFWQMRLAWALERGWSKAQILEAYLNLASYRGELQGITAAAHILFGKAPHGINDSEALILAVLLRGPNAEAATVVRRAVALQQHRDGLAAPERIAALVQRTLTLRADRAPRVSLAPHVAQRLLSHTSETGHVRSTLDASLQELAANTLRRHLMAMRTQHVYDGAILVVENDGGKVLAYVGGSGNLSSARYVDGVQGRRQTGSSLKPFLYGMALERKLLTLASLLEDRPLEVPVLGGVYRPRNYDEQFRGLVTLRTALAASLNIPAVRTLELVGAEAFVQQLRRLGFEGAIESGEYYGPSLALGSVDASLWELVQAYRTLARGGVWSPLHLTPQEPGNQSNRRVYSAATAFLVSHILADRGSRSLTFGLENPLATRFWSAVKTGTSKEMRDNWCIGYTSQYTVGVWVGNFSGEPMRNVSGVTGAAPIWGEIIAWLHRATPSPAVEPPAGVLEQQVSFPGKVEPERREWFLQGTEPQSLAERLAGGLPRIRIPVSGEVMALDPDIPPTHQRVVFAGEGTSAGQRWLLNGQEIGSATGSLLWQPVPGQHTLALVDHQRRVLDMVSFEVRPGFTKVGTALSREH